MTTGTNDTDDGAGDGCRGRDDSLPYMPAPLFDEIDRLAHAYLAGDDTVEISGADATAWHAERRRRQRVEAKAREVEERRQRHQGLRGHSRLAFALASGAD